MIDSFYESLMALMWRYCEEGIRRAHAAGRGDVLRVADFGFGIGLVISL